MACRHRFLGLVSGRVPVLVSGLGLGVLLLGACSSSGTTPEPDLTVPRDLRVSAGNTNVGRACDDTRLCPSVNGARIRCAVAVEQDLVGFCAPPCASNEDCDVDLPGLSLCTQMNNSGKSECVLFCEPTTRRCPQNWTCVAAQGYSICRPPQDPLQGADLTSTPRDM